MLSKLRKKTEGFTIIEVLIVLAIAGLILLIVFLAVPALQRNSRNTQRRNDIATVLGSIQEWSNNRAGDTLNNATGLVCNTSGSECNTMLLLAKRGTYTDNSVFSVVTAAADVTNNTTINDVVMVNNAVCLTNGNADFDAASSRQIAVLFSVEGSGGAAIRQCQDS